jgi:hypothetical protein
MKDKEIILEQYKLYANTAEKVCDRRQLANSFFLTINSVLLTFSGYLSTTPANLWYVILPIVGIPISYFWLETISSYRQLNTGKFKVIHDLEKKLPIALFKDEWNYLEKGETKTYVKLTVVESAVPIIFMILYVLVIVVGSL